MQRFQLQSCYIQESIPSAVLIHLSCLSLWLLFSCFLVARNYQNCICFIFTALASTFWHFALYVKIQRTCYSGTFSLRIIYLFTLLILPTFKHRKTLSILHTRRLCGLYNCMQQTARNVFLKLVISCLKDYISEADSFLNLG